MNFLYLFRITALAEGISWILLLFVSMPLKYIWGHGELNQYVGMAHGILFLAYTAFVVLSWIKKVPWRKRDYLIMLIAGFLPFATFYVERRYLAA